MLREWTRNGFGGIGVDWRFDWCEFVWGRCLIGLIRRETTAFTANERQCCANGREIVLGIGVGWRFDWSEFVWRRCLSGLIRRETTAFTANERQCCANGREMVLGG